MKLSLTLFLISIALTTNVLVAEPCPDFQNSGFKDGNTSCWDLAFTDGLPSVISSLGSFAAPFGDMMLAVPGGNFDNRVSRTFSSAISGKAAWIGNDYLPFNDNGVVKITQDGTILFQASISQYGNYGNSMWMPFNYFSIDGSPFTLEVISSNYQDFSVDSYILLDIAEEEILVDAGNPYLVLVGTETTISGSISRSGVPSEWSVDCTDPKVASDISIIDTGSLDTTVLYVPSEGTQSGMCTLTLTAFNKAGDPVAYSSTQIIAVDSSAGFATGGGYIISPEGAYAKDLLAVGKATFSFVSKYKKGNSIPSGTTQFTFEASNFAFSSTSYQWLVITGNDCAKYKGEDTIDEQAGFGFMLTACDNGEKGSGLDTFRIKIWDSDGVIVYDNQMGVADDSFAGTLLSGGNIQIHQPNAKSNLRA